MSVPFLYSNAPQLSRRAMLGGLLFALIETRVGDEALHAASYPPPRSFIEMHISYIIDAIKNKNGSEILRNRYLASCVYYSDAFCKRVANPAYQVDVPTKIVGGVAELITQDVRKWSAAVLQQHTIAVSDISHREHRPLSRFSFGHGVNHGDAVDLFTKEGSDVLSFSDGVVMVADSEWQPGDQYSSASMKGGNTVIVFNFEKGEFYRYAHLRSVLVSPGMVIEAGDTLGTVGNTGKNASKPGHGGHLHFEINSLDAEGNNRAVSASSIRARIQALL